MNISNLISLVYIIASLIGITACNGQQETGKTENKILNSKAKHTNPFPYGNEVSQLFYSDQNTLVSSNYCPARLVLDSASQIGEYVREIFEDSKGNLWFGTLMRGVARYNPNYKSSGTNSGNALTYYNEENGLLSNQINGIAEDLDGNIWFATTKGVSKYNPHSKSDGALFENFTVKEGLVGNNTWSILPDSRGNIWVGSMLGVSFLNTNHVDTNENHVFEHFPLPTSRVNAPSFALNLGLIWTIIEDEKGNIWFGTDGYGAFKYHSNTKETDLIITQFTKEDGLSNNSITSILEDISGRIWFASTDTRVPEKPGSFRYVVSNDAGISRYDPASSLGAGIKPITQVKSKQVQGYDFGPIYQSTNGHIWIASEQNGVFRFDGITYRQYKETSMTRYGVVQSMLQDSKGNMWFGFSGGLFILEGKSFINVTIDGPWMAGC